MAYNLKLLRFPENYTNVFGYIHLPQLKSKITIAVLQRGPSIFQELEDES